MGLSSLPLLFLLAAAPPLAPAPVEPVVLPMSTEAFETVLQDGGIPQLSAACADADRFGLQERQHSVLNCVSCGSDRYAQSSAAAAPTSPAQQSTSEISM